MKATTARRRAPLLPLAAGILVMLAACDVIPPPQEDPTRFFVLSDAPGGAAPAAQGGARIGLKTPKLEGYLRQRDMVVRTGANEVAFKDYRRWAEPLDAAIARSLRSGLLASGAVSQVYAEPFLDQERDYDVSVEILRFEGENEPSGRHVASLTARIEISTAGANPRVVAQKLFVAPAAPWDGSDYDQLASLLSKDVAALCREIAADIPARQG